MKVRIFDAKSSSFVASIILFSSVASINFESLADSSLPKGGVIIAGDGSFEFNSNTLNIRQMTPKMITEWIEFNIDENSSVNFIQPDKNSISLNRVISENPSIILGNLSANGQVFLVNSNGVLFGGNSSVDSGGLLVSTLDIENEKFLQENYEFKNGEGSGSIINFGDLEVNHNSYIALISPNISNNGKMQAHQGSIALISGDKVNIDFGRDGLITYEVERGLINSLVENNGTILSRGGTVIMSAKAREKLTDSIVNNKGIIKAKGFSSHKGRVYLHSEGGTSINSGDIDVSSENGIGGSIRHTGKNVISESGSIYNASGEFGGGKIEIGGSWQNTDPNVIQSNYATVKSGSIAKANSEKNGDGGRIVVWSNLSSKDGKTTVNGTLEAKGGINGGDGGSIETSGRYIDLENIDIDLLSPNGSNGTWLIDPTDITIRDSGTTTPGAADLPNYEGATNGSIITTADIETQLNVGTDVVIQTGGTGTQVGNIRVNGAIEKTSGDDASLTLKAHKNIFISRKIVSTSGKLDLHFQSNIDDTDGGVVISGNGTDLVSNGGNVTVTGGSNGLDGAKASGGTQAGFALDNLASITTNGGDVYIKANGNGLFDGVRLKSSSIDAGSTGGIHLIGSGENSLGIVVQEHDIGSDGNTDPTSIVAGTGGLKIEAYGKGVTGSKTGMIIGFGSLEATQAHEFKSNGGNVEIIATSSGPSGQADGNASLFSKTKSKFVTTGNGDITFDLHSVHGPGLMLDGEFIVNSAGNINLNASSDNARAIISKDSQLTQANNVVFQTGSGNISISAVSDDVKAINLEHGNYNFQSIDGNISLISDGFDFSSSNSTRFSSIGEFTISTSTFDKNISIGGSGIGLILDTTLFGNEISNAFSTINIGGHTHIGGVSIEEDLLLNTNLSLLQGEGDILIDAILSVPQSGTISVQTNGNSTQSVDGALIGDNLLLLGSGSHIYNSTLNDVNTLAANAGSLLYVDKDGLNINTVAGVEGINTTGTISLSTLSDNDNDDINIFKSIITTDSTQNALLINAGVNEGAGDTSLLSSRADIIHNNGIIQVGDGGRATFLTGSIAGSINLASLIEDGNFRYGSDENTTNYTAVLGSGLYQIYRERPTLNVAVDNTSKIYDSEAFTEGSYTTTGYLNNDDDNNHLDIVYGGTGVGAINAGDYTLTATSANSGLGYDVVTSDGSLTVNKSVLVVTAPSETIYENGQPYTPSGEINYLGFVGNEGIDHLNGEAVFSGEAIGAVEPGTYELSVSGYGSDNYMIEYLIGQVHIVSQPVPPTPTPPEVPEEPDLNVTGDHTVVDNDITIANRSVTSFDDLVLENNGIVNAGLLAVAVDFDVIEYIDRVPSNTMQSMSFIQATNSTLVIDKKTSFGLSRLPQAPNKMLVVSLKSENGDDDVRYKVDLFDNEISIKPLDRVSQINLQNNRKKLILDVFLNLNVTQKIQVNDIEVVHLLLYGVYFHQEI
ncbi:filamentous hemagglutinin N-terminal domain-containing protein [Enterovibrio norvegicus]|uniref:two-partner secretion domain-containing protein n=1 Tax=Enterovibrio norvegicus TaxID=188144 RepID=UPI003D119373